MVVELNYVEVHTNSGQESGGVQASQGLRGKNATGDGQVNSGGVHSDAVTLQVCGGKERNEPTDPILTAEITSLS